MNKLNMGPAGGPQTTVPAAPMSSQQGRQRMTRYTGPNARPAGQARDGRRGIDALRQLRGGQAPGQPGAGQLAAAMADFRARNPKGAGPTSADRDMGMTHPLPAGPAEHIGIVNPVEGGGSPGMIGGMPMRPGLPAELPLPLPPGMEIGRPIQDVRRPTMPTPPGNQSLFAGNRPKMPTPMPRRDVGTFGPRGVDALRRLRGRGGPGY